MPYEEEDTCISYEEDTCISYEGEDACMPYEEEDTCDATRWIPGAAAKMASARRASGCRSACIIHIYTYT